MYKGMLKEAISFNDEGGLHLFFISLRYIPVFSAGEFGSKENTLPHKTAIHAVIENYDK